MTRSATRRRPTLGTWLALAFSTLCVLLTLVLTVIIQRSASHSVEASIGARMADIARLTALRLDRGLFERHREIGLLAQRLAGARDPAQVRRELDAARDSYSYYGWIGMTDADGRVRAATGGMLEGQDMSGRDWFRRALEGISLTDVHEAKALVLLQPQLVGAARRVFDIAFPLGSPAGFDGLLAAHVSWQWANDIRQAVAAGKSGHPVDPVILSREGEVLLGPEGTVGQTLALESARRARAGEEGYLVEEWPDGRRYLVGYGATRGLPTTPGLGWKVLVRQDLEVAHAPVRDLQWRVAAGGLALALLFSVLGWLTAREVTRPLLDLADDARRLEAGESPTVRPSREYREVESLGQAMNSLVANLKNKEAELSALNAELEQRVELRTLELSHALERSRADQQRVAAIVEAAQDPFVGMDMEGRVTDWNSRAEAVFGWTREEMLGRRVADTLVDPQKAADLERWLVRFRATGDVAALQGPLERWVRDRSGRLFPVELRVAVVAHATVPFFGVFVQDITQRKEVERMKDEFVSTVSHELRTPLTAIYGSLSLVNSGLAGELPPEARELLKICHDSTERLIRLINEMLDVEKIASGRMEYRMERQPLRPLVEQALRDTQAYAEALGVAYRFEPGEDLEVLADADRIVQVCVNLLSNAAKFSPRGGTVDVQVRRRDGMARVSVVDHGSGIPPQFRARVFERFAQADASDRRAKGGTGLGLAICRGIVEAHHGRIGFESEPGVRTEFFFDLPLA